MSRRSPRDAWAAGEGSEPYIGRGSRRVECGTGALTRAVLDHAAPRSVLGVEPSAGFLAWARAPVAGPTRFVAGEARALPGAGASVGAAVCGPVLSFVPGPARAVAGMVRAARPGGVVAARFWDDAEGVTLIGLSRDAAAALDPAAADHEGRRLPICRPEPLRAPFAGAGLQQVEIRAIHIATDFRLTARARAVRGWR